MFQILQDALTSLHAQGEDNPFYQPVHTYVLNPKAITMEELYGGVNKLTLEWSDGLMAITVCINLSLLYPHPPPHRLVVRWTNGYHSMY